MGEVLYEEEIGRSWGWNFALIFAIGVVVLGIATAGYLIAAVIAFNLGIFYKAALPLVYKITERAIIIERGKEQFTLPYQDITSVEKCKSIMAPKVNGKRVPSVSLTRGLRGLYYIMLGETEPKGIFFKPSKDFVDKLKGMIPDKIIAE